MDGYYRPADDENYEPPKKKVPVGKIFKGILLTLVFAIVAVAGFCGSSYFMKSYAGKLSANNVSDMDTDTEETVATEETAESEESTEQETNDVFYLGAVQDVSDIVEEAMPSIVAITNVGTVTQQNFFGMEQSYESESAGSGIIIGQDEDYLYIATNNHVVSNSDKLTVAFVDDSSVSAEIKGTDSATDLAVVQVSLDSISDETKKTIRTAVFASSKSVEPGDFAIAIGNALGYGQSVTTGLVSALDREVTVSDDSTGETVTNSLIQTDAAINPGNSGGALLNMNGEVIGINAVKDSETSVEGMGYAIPASTAMPILNELITRESVPEGEEGYLGVSGVDVSDTVANTYSMPQGVYISKVVQGSAAEKAGLMQGDIITGFAGRNITTMEEIQDLLQYYKAGTNVEVVVQRSVGGVYSEITVSVELGKK